MDRTEELRASPPMFYSALLDRFTRVHPAVPVLIYAPVIAVLVSRIQPISPPFCGVCSAMSKCSA